MHPVTLCVTFQSGTRSVPGGIPTRSVRNDLPPPPHPYRSHALRGNASRDALRHLPEAERGASLAAFPRRSVGTINQDQKIAGFASSHRDPQCFQKWVNASLGQRCCQGALMGNHKIEIRRSNVEKILLAAEKVFAEKGFGSTAMADIAAEVQLPRSNLHYYFSTQERTVQRRAVRSAGGLEAGRLVLRNVRRPTGGAQQLHPRQDEPLPQPALRPRRSGPTKSSTAPRRWARRWTPASMTGRR